MPEVEKKSESPVAFSIEKVCRSSNFLKNLREVVISHPDESAKQLGLSVVYMLENKEDKLIGCLESLIASHPEVLIIRRRLAEVHINRNEYREAISYLEKIVKQDKNDFTAMIWLALCYYETSESKKGAIVFKSLRQYIHLLSVSDTNWT